MLDRKMTPLGVGIEAASSSKTSEASFYWPLFLCLPQVFGFFRPSFSLYLPSVNKQPSKGGGQKNERKLFYCQSCLRKKYCCILQVTTLPQFGFDLHKYPHSVWKFPKNVSYLKSIDITKVLWRHRCFFGRNGSDAPYARKNWKWDFLVIFRTQWRCF